MNMCLVSEKEGNWLTDHVLKNNYTRLLSQDLEEDTESFEGQESKETSAAPNGRKEKKKTHHN